MRHSIYASLESISHKTFNKKEKNNYSREAQVDATLNKVTKITIKKIS